MMYTLSQPLAGSDSTQIKSFLYGPLMKSLVCGLFVCILFFIFKKVLERKERYSFR